MKFCWRRGKSLDWQEDFNRLQGSETRLKNEVEELKFDNIEKDTRIVYLEGQISGLVSSLEKAREEAIASFKNSDEYKGRLDSHYAAGYEDFRADAKETFPDLDFDSFKLPLATESSVLQTSSEDVNVMDDANNEVTQGDPKTGASVHGGSSKWSVFSFKTLHFFLLGVPVVLGFISAFKFKFVQVQLPRPSLWMSYLYT